MNDIINSISKYQVCFLSENLLPTVSIQDKKIQMIALFIFAGLVIGIGSIYHYFKSITLGHLKEQKDNLQAQKKDPKDEIQAKGAIEKKEPTKNGSETLTHEMISDKTLLQIVELLDVQDTNSLEKTNQQFKNLLLDPKQLVKFLDKFSPRLTQEVRFQLALRCGKELVKLDLSGFQHLDEMKLNALKKACPHLQSLNLSSTLITTLTLPESLTELNVNFCGYLDEKEFKKLAILPGLEKLNASHTNIKKLDGLPKTLKTLKLHFCRYIEPQDFINLIDFSQLEELDVGGTQIQTLAGLPKSLKALELAPCNIEPKRFEHLAYFPQLEKLNVGKIQTLTDIPKKLKELHLWYCNVESGEYQHLSLLSQLEKLVIMGGDNLQSLDNLPKGLKTLHLINCTNIEPEGFEYLYLLLQLEKLIISNSQIQSLDNLPMKLKEVQFFHCKDIQPKDIEKLKLLRKDLIVSYEIGPD